MESMGCLRWLLMLVPVSLLTALGLGVVDQVGPSPLPPTPPNIWDTSYYYVTLDGSLQIPAAATWVVVENVSGYVSITNASNWDAAVNNQGLQSGEFVITVTTPTALANFGVNIYNGVYPVIDFFYQMRSPDATYTDPVPLTIGGRDALRVNFTNLTIPQESIFYAFAVQSDRVITVTLQALPGESALYEPLVTGLMERIIYLGDGYYGYPTPTMYDGGTLPYPTFYPSPYATYPPSTFPLGTPIPTDYTTNGFSETEYQMTLQAMYETIAAQSNQIMTLQAGLPTPTPIPTQTGAFTVEIADVVGAGDIGTEAVILQFNGNALMGDWSLISANNAVYYLFPPMLVLEGSRLVVHTGYGQDRPSDVYAGYETAQWRSGDTVYLYDSAYRLMDTFQIP